MFLTQKNVLSFPFHAQPRVENCISLRISILQYHHRRGHLCRIHHFVELEVCGNAEFTDSVHRALCGGGVLWVGELSPQSKGNESSRRCHMIGCVCVCHGATCSLRPPQSAGKSVPAELRDGLLPRQAGGHMQALPQGLRYLCR